MFCTVIGAVTTSPGAMALNVTAALAGVTPSLTVPVEKVLPPTDWESVKKAPVTSDVRPASATASTTRPMTRRRRSARAGVRRREGGGGHRGPFVGGGVGRGA